MAALTASGGSRNNKQAWRCDSSPPGVVTAGVVVVVRSSTPLYQMYRTVSSAIATWLSCFPRYHAQQISPSDTWKLPMQQCMQPLPIPPAIPKLCFGTTLQDHSSLACTDLIPRLSQAHPPTQQWRSHDHPTAEESVSLQSLTAGTHDDDSLAIL